MLTKGADSIISALLTQGQQLNLETIMGFVNQFATEGLRTLILA
jgi:hypothetical protein